MRLLAIVLLSGVLMGQDRKAAVGRVLDSEGRPAAKAAVTLFWTPPGDTLGERTDKIEVATDEHGRFVAQLLPQRGYSAFVIDSDGKISTPQDGLAISGRSPCGGQVWEGGVEAGQADQKLLELLEPFRRRAGLGPILRHAAES